MAGEIENYIYKPLSDSEKSIRLLRARKDPQGHVSIELRHFPTDKIPQYRALSYVWGTRDGAKQVTVGQGNFRIYPNLFSFLQKYCKRHPDDWIWIDQICINQDDIPERNKQVKLMSQIYSKAHEVLIWLNPKLYTPIFQKSRCDETCMKADHPSRTCSWYCGLQYNDYWKRLWIVQEVLLAHTKIVWYGKAVLSWSQLTTYGKFNGARNVSQFTEKQSSGVPMDLDKMMNFWPNQACCDVRDKVYGFQSILHEDERVEVDYKKEPLEVFGDWIAMVLSADTLKTSSISTLAKAMSVENLKDHFRVTWLQTHLSKAIRVLDARYKERGIDMAWWRSELSALMRIIFKNRPGSEDHRDFVEKWMEKHCDMLGLEQSQRPKVLGLWDQRDLHDLRANQR